MSGSALSDSPSESPVVFVSYSREDEEWLCRFTVMLKPLVRQRQLDVWSDVDRMVPGDEWRPQLAAAIARSRAALLLVSPSFLASDFIMDQELPALMERRVPLVPVLIRPCLWDQVPALERLQWAHDPRRDGPVANSCERDGQIVRICNKLMARLPAGRSAPGEVSLVSLVADRAEPLAAGAQPGELHDVPPRPRAEVERAELARLRDAMLGSANRAVGVTGAALGLHGQGGIGKTVLAATLARDEAVRQRFPDGVFWVTVGEQGDLVAAQIGLLDRLRAPYPQLRSSAEGLRLLRQALAERRCLLIVDDVWSAAAAAAFRAAGPYGRVLYTTRDPAVLTGVAAEVVPLGVLPREAARELLRGLTGIPVLPDEADLICAATGGVALAVALVGAAIGAGGRSWPEAVAQLEAGARTFLDHPYANTFKAMQVGIAALDEADAQAYRSLAVYPEDTAIPVAAIGRLWAHRSGDQDPDLAARLGRLAARSLLTARDDEVRFHDLQREFLLLQAEELALMHDDLLAAYRALLPAGASWAGLPPREPYIWDHLVYHLRGAGEGAAIRALAHDLAYLTMRGFRGGPYAVESDLRQAAGLFPGDAGIDWLLLLLTQWGHLFTGQPAVGDLAVTLASRLRDAPASLDPGELAPLFPACHLTPRWGLSVAEPGLLRVLNCGSDAVNGVAFSPDGRLLASAGDDGLVRLWDPDTGKQSAVLTGSIGAVNGVAFSPDGRLLASACLVGGVQLHDLAAGSPAAELPVGAVMLFGVAFSPDGRLLACAGNDGLVRLWDPDTGKQSAVLTDSAGPVNGVAFSPDGRLLAGAGGGGVVRLWDPVAGRPTAVLDGHGRMMNGVAFSPDGRLLAGAGGGGVVRLWDPATGQPAAVVAGHDDMARGVAFSPDGRLLASAGDDGVVRLWDPATGRPSAAFQGRTGAINGLAFSPDGRLLASAGGDGTVRLWDMAARPSVTGPSAVSPDGHVGLVGGVAFSPDGRLLASAGSDGTVRLWDPVAGRPAGVLEGQAHDGSTVAFSPDGRLLASGSSGFGDAVRLWDVVTRRPAGVLPADISMVNDLAFSPDGRLLASVGAVDRGVRLWDLVAARPAGILEGRADGDSTVAFSPDGRLLASAGGFEGEVRLWDPVTRKPAGVLKRNPDVITRVAFSPDGRLLASASRLGNGVRLWDLATRQPVAALEGHAGAVVGVAFSPDGRLLASVTSDGTVRLWDTRSSDLVSQLKVGVFLTSLAWGRPGIAVGGYQSPVLLTVTDRGTHPPESG